MSETKKPSPLDKLKSMSMDNLDQHRTAEPRFSLLSNDSESQPVALELIDPNPWQPRRQFENRLIETLAESIEELGLIEPIVVRKHENRFQIIVGERRWRAHQLLKRSHINAIVKCADDTQMAIMALAENLDREDLSDYEVALAIQNVQASFQNKSELARYLNKTRKELYRYLAFLELPSWLKKMLDRNPSLLNRTAADELKRLFAEESHASEKYREATLKALDRIESGIVPQIRLVPEIKRIAANEKAPLPLWEPMLFRNQDGKAVGKLKNNGKKITLTLVCSALGADQEKTLHTFVNDLVKNDKD